MLSFWSDGFLEEGGKVLLARELDIEVGPCGFSYANVVLILVKIEVIIALKFPCIEVEVKIDRLVVDFSREFEYFVLSLGENVGTISELSILLIEVFWANAVLIQVVIESHNGSLHSSGFEHIGADSGHLLFDLLKTREKSFKDFFLFRSKLFESSFLVKKR